MTSDEQVERGRQIYERLSSKAPAPPNDPTPWDSSASDEHDELEPGVQNGTPDGVRLTCLASVEPEMVTWLWPGRIPVGKLVTLDGDPGLGKSTLALNLAAVITTGGTWPDGTACAYPGDVILLSAEDGLADTTRPRSDAAGADVTRMHALEGVSAVDGETGEIYLRSPTLADVAVLEQVVTKTQARLLVIDVLMAYLPSGADSHKDQDIRRVLSRLGTMADRTGCTVLLLRHLNKAKGGDPMYRGGGSIGIVGAARAGLLVAPDPDDPERRVLASVKSNLGPPPESLAYRLVGHGIHGVARVQWEGHTEHTAFTLLANPDPDDDKGAATEAEAWLTDFLTEQGAAPSKSVKAEANKVGIRERTLQRAVGNLPVRVESKGFPRVTWWSLDRGATAPDTLQLGATGATGRDLHKRNGATGPEIQSRQAGSDGATGAEVLYLHPHARPAEEPPPAHDDAIPGMTDRVRTALANAEKSAAADGTFVPPTGPGRCDECGFHAATQGHRDGCPAT